MKWITFLLTAAIAGGAQIASLPAEARTIHATKVTKVTKVTNLIDAVIGVNKQQTILEAQVLEVQVRKENTIKINKALAELKKYVGRTWYVFSGDTPRGWDCSGLVMWTYAQAGINLEHRATIQARTGTPTTTPKPGDIVAFTYKGLKDAYHVGVYIGEGLMIHAPKHGHLTRIESIATFAGTNSKITYTRVLDN